MILRDIYCKLVNSLRPDQLRNNLLTEFQTYCESWKREYLHHFIFLTFSNSPVSFPLPFLRPDIYIYMGILSVSLLSDSPPHRRLFQPNLGLPGPRKTNPGSTKLSLKTDQLHLRLTQLCSGHRLLWGCCPTSNSLTQI